jgi:ATP-dependent RNA helicase YTHDC2
MFVHKLSFELGLKSRSKGKRDDRFITVTKKKDVKERKIFFELQTPTSSILSHIFQAYPLTSSHSPSHRARPTPQNQSTMTTAPPPSLKFYQMKQEARTKHANYNFFQINRSKLPASAHQETVLQLLKANNIILISGETGSVCLSSSHHA